MNLQFRRSDNSDVEILKDFYNKNLNKLNGDKVHTKLAVNKSRYLLAFDGDKLIGVTGINDNKYTYNSLNVEATALDPEYRHKGIMTQMIQKEIERVGRDRDIYCSCWRRDNDSIYLGYAMKTLGFIPLLKSHTVLNKNYFTMCKEQCNYYNNECTGQCYEDLYMLPAIKGV